jgi:hypothetical protein
MMEMASAQQLIGSVKSHAEGDPDRFFDLAMQLSAAEEQKGTSAWPKRFGSGPMPARRLFLAKAEPHANYAPRGDLAEFLFASYPSERLNSVILPPLIGEELAYIVFETACARSSKRRALSRGGAFCFLDLRALERR